MKAVVIGLGVQGEKRRRVAGPDYVCSVDPVKDDADYKRIEDVPLDSYDSALCCIPDEPKWDILSYLLSHGKHVLVEKPLWVEDDARFGQLETLARDNKAVCYTAYNHRFEPHFMRMAELIQSGRLGKIYRCRMFYGNGTARLVRNSDWRDTGHGVVPDLGSHLLDTAKYWFGPLGDGFEIVSANCFENRTPDHVVFRATGGPVDLECEMTLLMWRNHFTCDVFAENGSAHISSLCKWGPSEFSVRTRILPSGRPPEEAVTLIQPDPTWETEYAHFKSLCQAPAPADLSNDLWLSKTLRMLGEQAVERAAQ